MGGLSNYRAVGKFDVLEAPRSPIGAFDAEQFKKDALELFEKGSNNIIVDLGDLDFLYSDAFNAFSTIHQKLDSRAGSLGILAADELAVKSLQQAGVDRYVKVFRREPELMAATLQNTQPATAPRRTTVAMESIAPPAPAPNTPNPAFAAAAATPAAESAPLKRTHKFTQSFNSSLNSPEADASEFKGLPNAFDPTDALNTPGVSGGKVALWTVIFLMIAGGAVAWFMLR